MATDRPDWHPTMLLEGKHDTQLIPVLVDENGQMYIVMTGQQIAINNIPSDYNVIKGVETATPRYVAVDAAGIMLSRLKGAYGDTLKDVAVDVDGIILARLKGIFGDTLKDVAVDTDGKIIAIFQGNDGTTNRIVKLDTAGNIIARMKGYDGVDLQDVKVDPEGYMLAKMLGLYDSTLKVVSLDNNGIMKANLSTQSLDYLRVRPTYGQTRNIRNAAVVIPNSVWTEVFTITGKGTMLCGHAFFNTPFSPDIQAYQLYIDGVELLEWSVETMYTTNIIKQPYYPLSIMVYDRTNQSYYVMLGGPFTFESQYTLRAYHNSLIERTLTYDAFYALIYSPPT